MSDRETKRQALVRLDQMGRELVQCSTNILAEIAARRGAVDAVPTDEGLRLAEAGEDQVWQDLERAKDILDEILRSRETWD